MKKQLIAWERPLRKSNLEALGDAAPKGAILAVRVSDLMAKDALLQAEPDVLFTTPHFDGYPMVLVRLGRVRAPLLKELLREAWLTTAPPRLVAQSVPAARERLRKHLRG